MKLKLIICTLGLVINGCGSGSDTIAQSGSSLELLGDDSSCEEVTRIRNHVLRQSNGPLPFRSGDEFNAHFLYVELATPQYSRACATGINASTSTNLVEVEALAVADIDEFDNGIRAEEAKNACARLSINGKRGWIVASDSYYSVDQEIKAYLSENTYNMDDKRLFLWLAPEEGRYSQLNLGGYLDDNFELPRTAGLVCILPRSFN